MILKIVLNLYVTVELVSKQLVSSFDTLPALMFKRQTLFNKITSTKDASLAENKNPTTYIPISKTKVQISLTKCSIGNGHCSFRREI